MRAALLVFLLACGGSKKTDDGEIHIPILKEQPPAGSGATTAPVEETPVHEVETTEPTTPYTNDDLESPAKPTGGGQNEIAWTGNERGIALMKQSKYAEATSKFRDAVARVPDPSYFLNLCMSLHQEGKFTEALTACDAVVKNEPRPTTQVKADRMMGRIKWDAKKQGIQVR